MLAPDSLDCRLCSARDLAAQGVELLVIMQHRQHLGDYVGRSQIERSVPAYFIGIVFRGRSLIGFSVRLWDRQECESLVVTQAPEDAIGGNIDDAQRRCGGMPIIEKFVAVGEIQKPRADSVDRPTTRCFLSRKSALMFVDGWLSVCLLGTFGIVAY